MFTETIELRDRIDPEKLRKASIAKIVLGMNRAADILGGTLRRYSAAGPIHARTGTLAREWTLQRVPGEALAWKFVNRNPQAHILEEGGEIRPTNARALAIPLSGGPAMTERGVPRFPGGPRQVENAGHKLFILKTGGKPYLVESTAQRGRSKVAGGHTLLFWYAIRGGVTIPAFHYATKAVEDSKAAAVAEVKRALET